MTIMSFNIVLTFSGSVISSSHNDKFKGYLYSCVGWIFPLMLTFIIGVLQFTLPKDSRLNANMGREICFIHGKSAPFLLYIPILVIMIINSLIFLAVVVSLVLKSKGTRTVSTSTRGNPSR